MAQTVFTVGNPITSKLALGVAHDGTTNVSITVYRPDGTAIAPPAISAWVGEEKTAQFYATDDGTAAGTTLLATGDWVVIWRVTGTGAVTAAKVYNVAPLPGTGTRPVWSPFLSEVADFVPWLTVSTITPGDQTYLGTFNGNTSPTDEQAQRHVDAAAAFVGAGFGTLTTTLQDMARTVTAMWAASTLALAFARNAEDRATAAALERQAASSLKSLQAAADNAGADNLSAVPVMYAPAPVWYGDLPL